MVSQLLLEYSVRPSDSKRTTIISIPRCLLCYCAHVDGARNVRSHSGHGMSAGISLLLSVGAGLHERLSLPGHCL